MKDFFMCWNGSSAGKESGLAWRIVLFVYSRRSQRNVTKNLLKGQCKNQSLKDSFSSDLYMLSRGPLQDDIQAGFISLISRCVVVH